MCPRMMSKQLRCVLQRVLNQLFKGLCWDMGGVLWLTKQSPEVKQLSSYDRLRQRKVRGIPMKAQPSTGLGNGLLRVADVSQG